MEKRQMPKKRPSKKTETLEVRISPELKSAVGRLSAARGQSMSEVVRDLVDREIGNPALFKQHSGVTTMAQVARNPIARWGVGTASVLTLAVAYSLATHTPAIASATSEARVTFAELDRNGDQVVTPDEYAALVAEERAEDPEVFAEPPAACMGTFVEEEFAEEAEYASMSPEMVAQEEFAFLDSDQDGAVGFDELAAFVIAERAREFLEFDEDGNGFVTLDEVELAVNGPGLEVEKSELAEDGLSAACIDALFAGETDEAPEDARQVLAEYDANRDGRVGLVEFLEQ